MAKNRVTQIRELEEHLAEKRNDILAGIRAEEISIDEAKTELLRIATEIQEDPTLDQQTKNLSQVGLIYLAIQLLIEQEIQ